MAAGGTTGVCDTGVCNTGGTVVPVRTLTIQGNYTQTGGVLAYRLSPSSASGTLAVQGTAMLGGTLGVTVLPGLYPLSTNYPGVLTASAGVNGQFARSPNHLFSLSPSSGDDGPRIIEHVGRRLVVKPAIRRHEPEGALPR